MLGNLILTKNLSPGKRVYGEDLKIIDNKEYRVWNPFRSKLGAAIANGLREFPIKPGSVVLYLGSAEGSPSRSTGWEDELSTSARFSRVFNCTVVSLAHFGCFGKL
ncbi:MAG: Fibrillarin-like protein rRNA/tRNA 2'-O-methyltransferase [Parcubacteria group bacterium GW2011_GWA2_48_9]|nr:MAG: Fibrillarin-like protein rRNA/tRNA 2'-O-methyltransferase [Parcubacteria group bacterium GW2011_GWA2_48_9]